MSDLRQHARAIWDAAVDAARPEPLVRRALADLAEPLRAAPRILVLGAGKAGAAMATAVEDVLADCLNRVEGIVNVPADALRSVALSTRPLRKIRLQAARPAATNFPTAEGVVGSLEMLRLARSAGPDDVALCLLSGGGSALLPAPAEGVTLEDKLAVTKLLHQCGATINEMNAVRKHLSAIKGGRLAQAFKGKTIYSLIISDVIGDPLDVIASGPTAPDTSTFADALAILDRFRLRDRVPPPVLIHLQRGVAGQIAETPKTAPGGVHNLVLGNNAKALIAAEARARELGYHVLNLGSFIEGETRHVATVHAGIVRAIRDQGVPIAPPACILSGGETTVTLSANPGKGGRNQEFVLAAMLKLGAMPNVVVLSGGTDGEDGPTDAAGAIADASTLQRAKAKGLDGWDQLIHNDAYSFFEATGDLLITGLTHTNVMDVRVILVERERA
ncbi:MAG: glycerate kinase [Planctomycetes bacterium]|nr:glycerate kinase [Planctomycetota bacterium]